MYYCLLCDFQSDPIDDLVRHLSIVHAIDAPDVEFCGIDDDGVLYVGDLRVPLAGLALKALEDELARNKSPATAIHVLDDVVHVRHTDDRTTTVDLTTFVDLFTLASSVDYLWRHRTPDVDRDALNRRACSWLTQNRDRVFAVLLHRLDVCGRYLERSDDPISIRDLLWTGELELMDELLPPRKPDLPLPERASPEDWDAFFDWLSDRNNPEHDMTRQEQANRTGKSIDTIDKARQIYEYRKMIRKYEADKNL